MKNAKDKASPENYLKLFNKFLNSYEEEEIYVPLFLFPETGIKSKFQMIKNFFYKMHKNNFR
jgi:hypothetical protein